MVSAPKLNAAQKNDQEGMGNEEGSKVKSIAKGYGFSFLIAFVVALIGAMFEVITGFVTFTLMPDAAFIIINIIYFLRNKNKYETIGIGIGFVNLIFVIIMSIIVFISAMDLLYSIGWYDICRGCEPNLGF